MGKFIITTINREGTQTWADGAVYVGQWQDDKPHGTGKLTHADGEVYEGEWANDEAHGKGTYYYKDGSKYEGNWVNDKKSGYGVETFKDGSQYSGMYKAGVKSVRRFNMNLGMEQALWFGKMGRSTQETSKTIISMGLEHTGGQTEEYMRGPGIITTCMAKAVLNGQTAEFTKENTIKVSDTFVCLIFGLAFKKEGNGVYKWPDGRIYDGGWHNNKQHGEGNYTAQDGTVRRGLWKEGKRVKWLS